MTDIAAVLLYLRTDENFWFGVMMGGFISSALVMQLLLVYFVHRHEKNTLKQGE